MNKKGFTLIELLLVLAIIGIISAIAIPALLGSKAKTVRTSQVQTFQPQTNSGGYITNLEGASQDQVISSLGYPDSKFEPTQGVTSWIYTNQNTKQIVTFQNGRVIKHERR